MLGAHYLLYCIHEKVHFKIVKLGTHKWGKCVLNLELLDLKVQRSYAMYFLLASISIFHLRGLSKFCMNEPV